MMRILNFQVPSSKMAKEHNHAFYDSSSNIDGIEFLPFVQRYEVQNIIKDEQNSFSCVILSKDGAGTDSQLHTAVSKIKEHFVKLDRHILGTLSAGSKSKHTQVQKHDDLPLLRCFLGSAFTVDYFGEHEVDHIAKWIKQMKRKHVRHWTADLSTVTSSISGNEVTLLALPSLEQVQTIDTVIEEVKDKLKKKFSVSTITVHPYSKYRSKIQEHFEIQDKNAVILFMKNGKQRSPVKVVFKRQDINVKKITVAALSKEIGISHLNTTNFEWEALTVKRTERFPPYIIIFYAWWADHSEGFLTLLKSTVEELQSSSLMIKLALVNVAEEKTVVSRFINRDKFSAIPFIAVFQREKGKETVNQTIINLDHPSPFYFYESLKSNGVWLHDVWGNLWEYPPYQVLDFTHYTQLYEGPWGHLCSAWSHNQTESNPPTQLPEANMTVKETKPRQRDWFMPKSEGIPVMSESLWDAVIERSEVTPHSYNWHPDVRVTLIAFIRAGCGSCDRKMQSFKEIHQELQKTDNSQLYLVNCSVDSSLCQRLEVQGYPYVMAFRSFAALATLGCELLPTEKSYVRRDYHGPITTWDIIKWQKLLSQKSVSALAFEDPRPTVNMTEDVRLVATVIPKASNHLPLAPQHDRGYFYPGQCLQLACEYLFGLALCYAAYSKEIPKSEFDNAVKKEMVVTQILFERRDGVTVKLMSLGKPLLELIEEETMSDLHLFHKPHQYALSLNQKCEGNHQLCTQTVIAFTRDHLRLPVTLLTSELFHTKNNPLFDENKPVLIALGHSGNITSTSSFMQMLHGVATQLYKDVIVTVMDVDLYPAWAGSFVPRNYYRLYSGSQDAGPLHVYPRICFVNWQDHSHAAFYPPVSALHINASDSVASEDDGEHDNKQLWEPNEIIKYVKEYIKNPGEHMIQTEHF